MITSELVFFLSLAINGILAGAIYALIALAFVLVYKSSRIVNFALGEWIMAGALLVGIGQGALGLRLPVAILFAAGCMALFGIAFNATVVQRVTARPVISMIMITIGLGALMRGAISLLFAGIPKGLDLPPLPPPLSLNGIPVAPEKLIAGFAAAVIITLVAWFYRYSRVGLRLRALSGDAQAAMAAGIDLRRSFALLWGLTGAISTAAGFLWVFAKGDGFGLTLVGLKIFPIVIIGGLDSVPGTIIAAMLIGLLESLGAGYLDPVLGGGSGLIASWILMIAMLMARPYGMFGQVPAVRV